MVISHILKANNGKQNREWDVIAELQKDEEEVPIHKTGNFRA